MDKLLEFDGYDQYGPHIFPVDLGPGSGQNKHIKLATEMHPEIARYLSSATRIPDKTQLLIDALGAGEWWGSNKNGDYFPQDQLNPSYTKDFGHKTFMRYAYPFRHHVNKDPARAYGDKVILSAYHPSMNRVHLIVAVHDPKCQDILSQVENGDYPDVSMGTRVPYDVCSICGNRAKNRRQYCPDLINRMNRLLPDGRKVMAINYRPKFFDISFVMIGAEKASKVLMKVASQRKHYVISSAELGEKYYGKHAEDKQAEVTKKGTIKKRIDLDVKSIEPVLEGAPDVKRLEPSLSGRTIDSMCKHPLSSIFSTMAFMGIDPKPQEFQKIILIKTGMSKLAAQLESENQVFDENTDSEPRSGGICIDVNHVNEKLAYALKPYIEHRSCFNHHLINRLDKYAGELETVGNWYPVAEPSVLTSLPLAAGLGTLYKYIKDKSPREAATKFEKALSRHPWLLGLLFAGTSASAAGLVNLLKPQPFTKEGSLDVGTIEGYHKYASGKKALGVLAMAPLAYMYSGVQRSRAMRGERLNKFDRFIAQRPDVAAILSLIGGGTAATKGVRALAGVKKMMKLGSIYTDMGLFAAMSRTKLLPAALAGAAIDATVIDQVSKILSKKKKQRSKHGYPR